MIREKVISRRERERSNENRLNKKREIRISWKVRD